jgi:hypothetical protein
MKRVPCSVEPKWAILMKLPVKLPGLGEVAVECLEN